MLLFSKLQKFGVFSLSNLKASHNLCIGKKKVLTNLVITQKDEEKERKTIDKYMQTSLYCLVRYKMNK